MPKFAANLTMLYNELPFLQRFAAAADDGFSAVEFLFPYAHSADDVAAAARSAGVQVVLHNLPPGDWDGGERGIACLADRSAEFRAGVEQALVYAQALGVTQLNALAGRLPDGADRAAASATLVSNLGYAAERLAAAGIKLLLEPINHLDMPGYLVNTTAQAMAVLDAVGSTNLWLQADIYHMQRMEGELAATLERLLPRIAHIQIADNPGRNEPGSGEINYPFLFRHLDRIGYAGWVGCEYKPQSGTSAGLGWLRAQRHPQDCQA